MNRLKEARLNAGLSQKEVSIILKVAPPTISQWESEKKTPMQQNLIKLADLYGVTTDYLLGKEDKKKEPSGQQAERLNPKAQALIERIESLSPREVQTLEKLIDFVIGLRDQK